MSKQKGLSFLAMVLCTCGVVLMTAACTTTPRAADPPVQANCTHVQILFVDVLKCSKE
jgi:hypothetical protein